MTREDALELIERIPYITTYAALNEKFRTDCYRKAVAKDDPVEWIKSIKTFYILKNQISGKKIGETEPQYAAKAKERLHSLLAESLGIKTDEVEAFVKSHLESKM
ncbi:MAG: hypothetical protein Q4F74_00180 [Synergistaceae bacterium]|nr:hypothetical protein [Synergistaceae bacterium]